MDPNYQKDFIEKLLTHYSKSQIITLMVELLSISKQAAYNYVNGDRSIDFNSMTKLLNSSEAKKLFGKNDSSQMLKGVLWVYQSPPKTEKIIELYMHGLCDEIKMLDPKVHSITFATGEIPIFYYMYIPFLMAFKLYGWRKTIWNEDKDFLIDFKPETLLTHKFKETNRNIIDHFSHLSSIEFWNTNMLDITINQIAYFKQMEWVTKEDYHKLFDSLKKLIQILQKIVMHGKKMTSDLTQASGESSIYDNEIYFSSNTFIVHSDHNDLVYTSFDNPNYMTTDNLEINERCLNWTKGMKNHSTTLTQNKELYTKHFFNKLQEKIESKLGKEN